MENIDLLDKNHDKLSETVLISETVLTEENLEMQSDIQEQDCIDCD